MTRIDLVNCIQKMFRTCQGCKAIFPIMKNETPFIEGSSVNRYGVSSPECIVTFCKILEKEQEWAGYPEIHRLFIDAYAVQHPPCIEYQKKLGINQRLIDASIQSIFVHLIALYLAFEKNMPLRNISKRIAYILDIGVKLESIELKPPNHLGDMTIVDIRKTANFKEYETMVWRWAKSAWDAWQEYHTIIEQITRSQEVTKQ